MFFRLIKNSLDNKNNLIKYTKSVYQTKITKKRMLFYIKWDQNYKNWLPIEKTNLKI